MLCRAAAAVALLTLAGCAGLPVRVASAGSPVAHGAVAHRAAAPAAPPDPHALAEQIRRARVYLAADEAEAVLGPLQKAAAANPKNPDVRLLLGVANDMTGHHKAAQNWYRLGLQLAPEDRALKADLALSLALGGDYPAAIKLLRPLAAAAAAGPAERQTLALIYGLAGKEAQAARLGRIDLSAASVKHNLAYYEMLRKLSPAARGRLIASWVGGSPPAGAPATSGQAQGKAQAASASVQAATDQKPPAPALTAAGSADW